jgi:ribosomal protein S12 methylthiotransferase
VAEIETEVRGLVERGVTEIQVVSQNTSDYGRDTGDDLLDLVRRLDRVAGLRRIRLLYLYAGLLATDTALALLELDSVAPYLDVPVQHASPRILRAMRRPGDPAVVEDFFRRLRRERPDVVLRTTALLGFPGEDEADVEMLMDFLGRVEFDHLGTYRYSPEAGTPAATLPGAVGPEEVADREARILDLQTEIAHRRMRGRLGRKFEVVVDAVAPVGAAESGAAEMAAALADGVWCDDSERAALERVLEVNEPVARARSYHFGYDLDGGVLLPGRDRRVGEEFRAVTPFDVWALPSQADLSNRGRP